MYTEIITKEVQPLDLLTNAIKQAEGDDKRFRLPALYRSEVIYIRSLIENKLNIKMSLKEVYRLLVSENIIHRDNMSEGNYNLYPNIPVNKKSKEYNTLYHEGLLPAHEYSIPKWYIDKYGT